MANSNKTGLLVLVILVILGVVAYFVFASGSEDLQGRFQLKQPKKMDVENEDEIMMEPSPLEFQVGSQKATDDVYIPEED